MPGRHAAAALIDGEVNVKAVLLQHADGRSIHVGEECVLYAAVEERTARGVHRWRGDAIIVRVVGRQPGQEPFEAAQRGRNEPHTAGQPLQAGGLIELQQRAASRSRCRLGSSSARATACAVCWDESDGVCSWIACRAVSNRLPYWMPEGQAGSQARQPKQRSRWVRNAPLNRCARHSPHASGKFASAGCPSPF